MATEVYGGIQTAPIAENGMPFLQGSNNLIKIKINNPIDLNLETFKNNIFPYLDGSHNIVDVEINSTENTLTNIELEGAYLKLTKRTLNGESVSYVDLPWAKDGDIKEITYNGSSVSVEYYIDSEKHTATRIYAVEKDDQGVITSIKEV